jgi:predicted alpha/beta-hydrolase family hydrolase
VEIQTEYGLARALVDVPDSTPTAVLALGHGAGGDVTVPDLTAVRNAALGVGLAVVRITQPYRVAGKRSPAPARQLDAAWLAALAGAVADPYAEVPLANLPLVVGGRSSGARVACRTAVAAGAAGVLALAFPLHPPGKPDVSRGDELLTGVPTLVVNGDRDPFGVPEPGPGVEVAIRPGDNHSLKRDAAGLREVVVEWLRKHDWAA